jgi:CRISPR-associated protein Cmr1
MLVRYKELKKGACGVDIQQLKQASAICTRSYQLELLTPLFVHGWQEVNGKNGRPISAEWRIPSWRGIMRYWWRTLKAIDVQQLQREEERLFGGTSSKEDEGGKSPVFFCFHSNDRYDLEETSKKALVCPDNRNMRILAIPVGRRVELEMRLNYRFKKQMDIYDNLCRYIFMVGAIGQRARRGGGALQIRDFCWQSKGDYKNDLQKNLEAQGVAQDFTYETDHPGCLLERSQGEAQHPILQRIWIGEEYEDAEHVRRAIDHAANIANNPSSEQYLGKAGGKNKNRLSSPLWCTVRRIDNSYYPIITELSSSDMNIKEYREKRNEFLQELGVKL